VTRSGLVTTFISNLPEQDASGIGVAVIHAVDLASRRRVSGSARERAA
jgi:hypothetical protein